jgi:DNA-binding MarR family transcriptional regulator
MILQDIPSALLSQDQSFDYVRGLVAVVLLEHAGNGTTERRWLTQRDIANITGTSWGTVHLLLKSLQDKGAIRIEHARLIINRESLQKIAGFNTK